ncbi:hypothetical protein D9M71_668390 [compost metagenome]
MKLQTILRTAIEPALRLLPGGLGGERAEVMLLAIGLQESGFDRRRPRIGPARGFWRAAPVGGMVGAVLRHPASAALAAVLARLLLHIEGERLPPVGEVADARALYCQAWRPAETRRQEWDGSYARAMDAMAASV